MKDYEKLKSLFNSYGLDIFEIVKGNFLNGWKARLPFEEGTEYRVTVGEIFNFKMLIVQNDLEDLLPKLRLMKSIDAALILCKNHYIENHGQEDYDKYLLPDVKKLDSVQKVNQQLEFSIFADGEIDAEGLKMCAWQSAYLYFSVLKKSVKDIYSGHICESSSIISLKKFSKFLNTTGCEITNDVIHKVDLITYRLYKDSKFFYELKDYFDDSKLDYSQFVKSMERIR